MAHQMAQEDILWPSSMIRLGPHWHNSKKWANIVNAVLDDGTWIFNKVTMLEQLKMHWLTHSLAWANLVQAIKNPALHSSFINQTQNQSIQVIFGAPHLARVLQQAEGRKQEFDKILVNYIIKKLDTFILSLNFAKVLLHYSHSSGFKVVFWVKFIVRFFLKCKISKVCTISDWSILFNH